MTVIVGVWMCVANGVFESASARNIGMTLGVALAILALLLGASANRIAERNWIRAVNNVGRLQ